MATYGASDTIVPFLLQLDHYEDWTIFLKNYLLTHDLWDVVEKGTDALPSLDKAHWSKKNAAALHAIYITCPSHLFAAIKDFRSAKEVWNKLAEVHQQWQSQAHSDSESSTNLTFAVPLRRTERPTASRLEWAIRKGDWKTALKIFQESSYPINRIINDSNQTALHVAVFAGAVEIAEELTRRMSETDLEIQDISGATALHFAAHNGKQIAECLVKKNPKLPSLPNVGGRIPIVVVCTSGDKDSTKYLYRKTPEVLLSPDGGNNGPRLLSLAIAGEMFGKISKTSFIPSSLVFLPYMIHDQRVSVFLPNKYFCVEKADISWDLLRKHPSLAVTHDGVNATPIVVLSNQPSAFFSGSGLGFWQRLIYHRIKINEHSFSSDISSSNNVRIPVTYQDQNEEENIKMQVFFGLRALDLMLLKFPGIKQIYDLKLNHTLSREVLKCMCEHITTLDYKECEDGLVFEALVHAIHNGMEEFVVAMLRARPHMINIIGPQNSRTTFMCAIEHRQGKIFSFFCSVDAWKHCFHRQDDCSNNCLHIAGMLAPDFQLACISGAALKMQRELQWFKEVESIVPEWCKTFLNNDGETPSDVFTKSHKELAKQGEEWMKATASSSSVVGSLIITIMFAAIFTVPGGNNQETGFPIFLGKKSFMVFLISDAICLFTACISVLMFLGILTSRYAEEDFYKSLPRKLILGLSTLFISIATMMVTFSSALSIMLQFRWSVILPIILLAALPVTLFMRLQFPLLVQIFISTYRSGILVKTEAVALAQ